MDAEKEPAQKLVLYSARAMDVRVNLAVVLFPTANFSHSNDSVIYYARVLDRIRVRILKLAALTSCSIR